VAAFYLDNDVSERLWHLLRIQGHQVFLTKDQHPTRVPDEHQLVTALDLKAHLVTHNYRDFVLLHRAWLLWTSRWRVTHGQC
jgi:hypothetical protein